MADIKPFRAWRYDCQTAGPAETLITQPYDVIDAAKQEAYYGASPNNIIRLEWGKTFPDDDESNNRYSRAAADFAAWRKAGILKQDEYPSLYPYVQEYMAEGRAIRRRGFLTTVKAAGYADGQVLPHEETMPGHKEDRYRLTQACLANFSPIFGLYNEESRIIDTALEQATAGKEPLVDFEDEDGVRHIMWQVTDQAVIQQVEHAMAAHKIYIADGHHRYETASRFAADMAAQGAENCDHLLIHLVNLHDPGLTVLPTHRLAKKLEDFSAIAFVQALTDMGFAVLPQDDLAGTLEKMASSPPDIAAFGLFCEGCYYLLLLDRDDTVIADIQKGFSAAYQRLDVSIAQSLILEALCGIGREQLASGDCICYSRGAKEAVEAVKSGDCQFALLLNATHVAELLAVAAEGEKMPQKSTYFYPKVIAGLVINELE
jgi:uncharacterized protein (DUF1015 family)